MEDGELKRGVGDEETSREAHTVLSLISQVLHDKELESKEKRRLIDEIRKTQPALEDRWIYRTIIYFLGATVVLTVLGGFITYSCKDDMPDGLIALGSAAIGALAALLSKRPGPLNKDEDL